MNHLDTGTLYVYCVFLSVTMSCTVGMLHTRENVNTTTMMTRASMIKDLIVMKTGQLKKNERVPSIRIYSFYSFSPTMRRLQNRHFSSSLYMAPKNDYATKVVLCKIIATSASENTGISSNVVIR